MQDVSVRALERQHSGPISYRIRGVSQATGLSERTIERAIARGELDAIKVGRSTVILAAAVESWLTRLGTHN